MLTTRAGSGNARLALCALLLCALAALVAPPVASAATFEVDSTADLPDKDPGAPCETVMNTCTFRAAIQASNSTPGTPDEIAFKPNPFNGQLAASINIPVGDPLPPITDSVVIDGDAKGAANGQCITQADIAGPCVGLNTMDGLVVQDDEVTIEGLAIGGLTAIHVQADAQTFAARGNWFGINLNGDPTFIFVGIFLDRGADFAQIGGPTARERNVFAGNNNSIGLDIEGASNAEVVGNYFGLGADGVTPRLNRVDIEITDSTVAPGFPAVGNEIGAPVDGAAAGTSECDGGCNVIAADILFGVDLNGNEPSEAPATGPTQIHGNFFGLKANGTEDLGVGAGTGVLADEAGEVTIGGDADGDANFFSGGNFAVESAGAPDLTIEGNAVGLNALRTGNVTPPGGAGFLVASPGLEVSEAAHIAENDVRMDPAQGLGIALEATPGASVVDNAVTGGQLGILSSGPTATQGNLVAGNEVSAAAIAGIHLENDDNEVIGNDVLDVEGPGIRIDSFDGLATGNLIGGDGPGAENTISGNEGAAIEIEAAEASQNEVGRNVGRDNSGPFVDLIPRAGESGPNGGIKPPAFSSAFQSSANGTALPGARVRVFRKASAEPGELASFLGEAVADAGGNWKVGYPGQLPVGTIVAATQTNTLGGTSELATATAGADPPPTCPDALPAAMCQGPAPCPPMIGGICGGGPDRKAPMARIGKGPKVQSFSTTAKFRFSSNEPGSTFQCKLDKGKFKKCRSPKTYRNLKPGKHVFRLRAVDTAGNVGPVAKRTFTVLTE